MFVYVEMILMGVILGLMMREAPQELFCTKRVLLYSGITSSLAMVLFDPRFLPFFWGALSLYLLVWWPFLRNKYKVAILITVLLALVPFVVSLYLTPHILDFRPAHSKPFFFATSGQSDILSYLESSMESLYEMTFQSSPHFYFALICCGLGIFVLQKRASLVLLGFIVFIPLGAFIASLLDLYPFGHIRYLLPWFGVGLVLVSTGVWGVVKLLSVKLGKRNKAESMLLLSILACITVLLASSLAVSFEKVSKVASLSNATKEFYAALEEFDKKLSICDAPSAVLLKAQGLNCDLNIGWGYQKKEKEASHILTKNIKRISDVIIGPSGTKCVYFASFKRPNTPYYIEYIESIKRLGIQFLPEQAKNARPSPYVISGCLRKR